MLRQFCVALRRRQASASAQARGHLYTHPQQLHLQHQQQQQQQQQPRPKAPPLPPPRTEPYNNSTTSRYRGPTPFGLQYRAPPGAADAALNVLAPDSTVGGAPVPAWAADKQAQLAAAQRTHQMRVLQQQQHLQQQAQQRGQQHPQQPQLQPHELALRAKSAWAESKTKQQLLSDGSGAAVNGYSFVPASSVSVTHEARPTVRSGYEANGAPDVPAPSKFTNHEDDYNF